MSLWQWIITTVGWVVAILFGIAAIVVAFIWLDAYLTRKTMRSIFTFHRSGGRQNGTLVVALPGILAGESSFQPILSTLQKYGEVVIVNYDGEKFDARQIVDSLVSKLKDLARTYDHLVFFGSSMGGMLALDAQSSLRQLEIDWRRTSIVFVDSPSGSADMLNGGNIGAPLLRGLPTGRAFNLPGAKILNAMILPPKDENIEEELDKAQVKKSAILSMRRFPFSLWRDELAYMAARRWSQYEMFSGFDRMIYLRCDRDNVTIKQPQAGLKYVVASGYKLRIQDVDSTHCGYAERPATWNLAIDTAMQYVTGAVKEK